MKKTVQISLVALLLTLMSLSYVTISSAAETDTAATGLNVLELVIARDVVDREPVDVGDKFPADVHQLYSFSKIQVDIDSATVFHTWYYNDAKVFQIELNVKKSPGFRTYSSKTILPHQKGKWEVEVQDAEGNILSSTTFTIE